MPDVGLLISGDGKACKCFNVSDSKGSFQLVVLLL